MPKVEEKRSRGRRAVTGNGRRDERETKADGAVTEREGAALPPLEPEMYINRELSWLDFNNRVLFEAEESANPLLERVKFAAIFAGNLDEFFMIRVAGIKRKLDSRHRHPRSRWTYSGRADESCPGEGADGARPARSGHH